MFLQQISTTNLYNNNGRLGEFQPIDKCLTTRGCNSMFNFSIFIIGRLNYKYHRLVASSDRPGELPQVEKCVVDDDEEDEEEVRQMFLCFPGRCFPFYVLKTLWWNFANCWKTWDNIRTSSRRDFRKPLQLVKLYQIIHGSWYEFYSRLCFAFVNCFYR